jgi:hypothetical protein
MQEDVEVFADNRAPGTLVELVAICEGWFGGNASEERPKRDQKLGASIPS